MIGTIATSNDKHQIVIPKSARKMLGITEPAHYYVTVSPDQKIILDPFTEVQTSQRAKNLRLLKILRKTQGAWANDNWPEEEKKIKVIPTLKHGDFAPTS